MNRLPYLIHEEITAVRRRPSARPEPSSNSTRLVNAETPIVAKEYPRMPRIQLPVQNPTNCSLETLFRQRISSSKTSSIDISLNNLSTLLYGLSTNERGSRVYPSGGAKYPSEAYVLVQNVSGVNRGVYHYHSPSHSLEHLWELRQPMNIFGEINKWAEEASIIIMFTANWWKNSAKYDDFGYLLGLLEIGHAAQNVLLSATALNLPSCPLAGFNDNDVAEILDIDPLIEQPVYCMAIG